MLSDSKGRHADAKSARGFWTAGWAWARMFDDGTADRNNGEEGESAGISGAKIAVDEPEPSREAGCHGGPLRNQ